MAVALGAGSAPVDYQLRAGDARVALNERLGQPLRLTWEGQINCIHCARKTNKSFGQGYCYPCFKRLAQCDTCIVKPELCHYFQGTCREPAWGEAHCFTPHIVYLANSSGLKVGITRKTNMPTRWIDQGAIQALPILEVATRQQSGLVETLFKQHVADRTNWRAMLKGEVAPLDLCNERDRLLALVEPGLDELRRAHGDEALRILNEAPLDIRYPVETFPAKIVSHNLDKSPVVEGVLQGVKGQYLMLDTGVINLRKFTGYQVSVD
ncbi:MULTISPECIES: DUF2797 domain-containing protein [unclassified Halomonas]|uniref:DUF2797 domain-containing protein n=1 Tax=unclassified Halomonas TaxID=2609666 RepID=UPI0020A1391E|nr:MULTISPECIES: DUF2797 domain-containing protein [unclassified Halomonas]MCP1315532.1 DUF2797 domain-containing protein [Halomonas sp. 707D7]MCP1326726.1 DUF2797 domain-containing protein [Halomonas sp. 707D4]